METLLRRSTARAVDSFLCPDGHSVYAVGAAALLLLVPQWAWWSAAAAAATAAGYFLFVRRSRAKASRYTALFNDAPAPILVLNDAFRIVEANEAARDMSERLIDERGRQHVQAVIAFDTEVDWSSIPSQLADAGSMVLSGRIAESEPDKMVDVRIRSFSQKGSVGYVVILNDVTERKKKFDLFREFHRQILNHIPTEVAVLSPQGQYVYANPRVAEGPKAQAWLQQKTDVDYGQKLGLHPEVSLRRRSHRKRAIACGERVHFEETLSLPNGSTRHFDRYYAPIFDLDGGVYAVVSYGLDTTVLQKQREEAEEAREKREQYMRLRRTLMDNLRHEFRTPLTGIIGAAEVLQQEVGDDQQDFVGIVEENGRRLMSTLNALLDLAGLDAEGLQLKPEVVDVVSEVHETVASLEQEVEEKGLFLRVKAPESEHFARLDRAGLQRVLHSLIGNAIKFTDDGGVVVEVDQTADDVAVRIMDTGRGIEEEFLPYLFEEFRQESMGLTREYDGTGLGLAVVKRLIDRMDGSIEVDTSKEEGSTFTLRVPRAFVGAGSRPRLLVAEANADARKLFRRLLDPHFDIEVLASLGAIPETVSGYDVVLLNVQFDESADCAEVLQHFQDHGEIGTPAVVAVETDVPIMNRDQCLAMGYSEYLSNPFQKTVLLNSIHAALQSDAASFSSPVPV